MLVSPLNEPLLSCCDRSGGNHEDTHAQINISMYGKTADFLLTLRLPACCVKQEINGLKTGSRLSSKLAAVAAALTPAVIVIGGGRHKRLFPSSLQQQQ